MSKDSAFAFPSQLPLIDWPLLGKAASYYQAAGFEQVEVPWSVPKEISRITAPEQTPSWFEHSCERTRFELIGSAEQGFIDLILKGDLKPGRYFSVSPCFRAESYDQTHLPWFVKLELISYRETGSFEPEELLFDPLDLLDNALGFYEKVLGASPSVVSMPAGCWDLEINGIEIGSFGARKLPGSGSYAYGTGLALPRFSLALSS